MVIFTPWFYYIIKVGPWGDRSLKLIGLGPLSPRWLLSHPGGFYPSLGPEGGLKGKALDLLIPALHLGGGLFRYTGIVGPLGRIRKRVFRSVFLDHHPFAVTGRRTKLFRPVFPLGPLVGGVP